MYCGSTGLHSCTPPHKSYCRSDITVRQIRHCGYECAGRFGRSTRTIRKLDSGSGTSKSGTFDLQVVTLSLRVPHPHNIQKCVIAIRSRRFFINHVPPPS